MYPVRRRAFRRRVRRAPAIPRAVMARNLPLYLHRESAPTTLTTVTGFLAGIKNMSLSEVPNSDLQAIFQEYRIIKVVAKFAPLIDPGNSGVASNGQISVIFASDPFQTAAPATANALSAYSNHKRYICVAGKTNYYTFYPKVQNEIFNGTAAANLATYQYNPWLSLGASGVTVPHFNLMYYLSIPSLNTAESIQITYEYHFEVRGIK